MQIESIALDAGALTQLIVEARAGDNNAYAQLYEHLYGELKRHAQHEIAVRPASTLSATVLVHEAFLKLNEPADLEINDRRHFLRVCVRAMRQILIDHYRAGRSDKRGGQWRRADAHLDSLADPRDAELVFEINDVLETLHRDNDRVAEVVEYKFFLGLCEAEIARTLQVSERTVRNDWKKARMWIARQLGGHALPALPEKT